MQPFFLISICAVIPSLLFPLHEKKSKATITHVPLHNLREDHLEKVVEELLSNEHDCKLDRDSSDARVVEACVLQIGSEQHLATKPKYSNRKEMKNTEKEWPKLSSLRQTRRIAGKLKKRGTDEGLTGTLKNA